MEYTDINMIEMKSKLNLILSTLETIRDGYNNRTYTTEELCEYLKVGKSVIDKYRQNGELSYSKIGRTYIYTQKDVDELLFNNRVHYVA